MSDQLANYHYNLIVEMYNREIKTLEKYVTVNKYLKENDWLFISPLFFQGYELNLFFELSKTADDNKRKILEIITNKFYDLKNTASFIEGYCNRSEYIKPFLGSIENSLILTFQRDYEGSIKTIIPIIEGILRKYLILEKNKTTGSIGYKDLKNSFEFIRIDLINAYTEYIRNYKDENRRLVCFSNDQINELIKIQEQYYDIWFSFVNEFVQNSFYLNTKGNELTNEVNRHSILHEFGLDFKYNLENYIKIYFLLQFLTWIFLKKERKSILNQIDSSRWIEKIFAYEKIIKQSEKLLYEKHILLKNYDGYDESFLKEKLPEVKNDILPKKQFINYNIIRKLNKFLWNKK